MTGHGSLFATAATATVGCDGDVIGDEWVILSLSFVVLCVRVDTGVSGKLGVGEEAVVGFFLIDVEDPLANAPFLNFSICVGSIVQ